MNDLLCLTAVEQASLIRTRRLSPLELFEAVSQRIEALNPSLNAYCTLALEAGRDTARKAEQAVVNGSALGPLHGLPISVKDLISTAGLRTTYGSRVYAELIPDENDIAVDRVLEAGAVLLGKTNTPEFGYQAACDSPLFGASCNPWDPARTTGGSSGGSAAAVATGMGSLSLGSDGGGSLRIPASLCGIVALKPTFGLVPVYPSARDPSLPGGSSWETLDHIGPMTRSVQDAHLLLSVIAGYDGRDRHALPGAFPYRPERLDHGIRGQRVAFSLDWGWATVDPEVRATIEEAVQVFESDLGCRVEEAHPPFTYTQDDFWKLVASEADLTGLRQLVANHQTSMSASVIDLVNTPWTAEQFTDAKRERQRITNALHAFFGKYDLFLTPTVAVPAFGHGMLGPRHIDSKPVPANAWIPFTHPFNLSGQPAISVPAGWTAAELPVGLQIAGRRMDDLRVLQAARAFEQARSWHHRWPSIIEEET
ncbi:MAG TPA: amidase family protein [Trueperaceae bacterium]